MIVDTNINLSRWPFRRLKGDEPEDLVAQLRRHDVTEAWAGSFDGLLHKDLAAVNARLAADCRKHGPGLLVPFGSVNPKLPDWQLDVRRCREEHKMPGIRLHPAFHGYTLDDPVFAELLHAAAEHSLLVQLVLAMEDPRTEHPLVLVPEVKLSPLPDLVRQAPGLRLVILNARSIRSQHLAELSSAGEVYFDFAMQESTGRVARLARDVTVERVVFGSHFPFYHFESSLLKVREAALTPADEKAVFEGNARRLMAANRP